MQTTDFETFMRAVDKACFPRPDIISRSNVDTYVYKYRGKPIASKSLNIKTPSTSNVAYMVDLDWIS